MLGLQRWRRERTRFAIAGIERLQVTVSNALDFA